MLLKKEFRSCKVVTNTNQEGKSQLPYNQGDIVDVEYTEHVREKTHFSTIQKKNITTKIVEDVTDKKINREPCENFLINTQTKEVFAW